MNYPLKNYIVTQRFGETITDPKGHTGIDLWQPIGTPVYAVEGGDVLAAGVINNAYGNNDYGRCILIDHRNGYYTFYAHLASIMVSKGMSVMAGAQIGTVGDTGNVTGPHLHFEVRTSPNWNRASFIDPEKWLGAAIDKPNIIETNKPSISMEMPKISEKQPKFKKDDKVKINGTLVNMRDNPGYSSNILLRLKHNYKLKISGEPIEKDGLFWYPVQLDGYIAETDGYSQLLKKDE